MKKINIAIDGYSACGKSTLAKQLAHHFHYLFLDTGAMYRAVTLYILQQNISWKNIVNWDSILSHIQITFNQDQSQNLVELNGKIVEKEIRSMAVNQIVSEIAAISPIRKFLVSQQREIGKNKGVVLDGRDIGTVVFPNAELKLFIIADFNVRVNRRHEELIQMGIDISVNEIANNLKKRDFDETTRIDSPLIKAEDAIEIDNTNLTLQGQFNLASYYALEKIQFENSGIF